MSERELLLVVAAFFVGRMQVLGIQPFAVGLFLAIAYEGLPIAYYMGAICLGMWSGVGGMETLQYALILSVCGIAAYLMRGWYGLPMVLYSIVGVLSTFGVKAILWQQGYLRNTNLTLLALEALLAGVFCQILYIGIHNLLSEKKTAFAGNEELISIMILVCLVIYGLPYQENNMLSVQQTALTFFALMAGYKYGSGAGCLAGAISGLFFVGMEKGVELLGVLTLLGMAAGVFRELGKLVSVLTYVGIYCVCGVYWQGGFFQPGKIRGVLLAGCCFLLLPNHFSKRVESLALEREYALYGWKQMEKQVKKRLEYFAEPFFSMSRTFEKMSQKQEDMEEQDMNRVLAQVEVKLCRGCEKANRCLGFTRHEKYNTANCILGAARENGYLCAEDFPKSFSNKCDYLPSYVDATNQALQLVYNNVQWQNRLAESREAIAGQFRDIGGLLKDFSREICKEEEIELEEKRDLLVVLRRNQILVRQVEKLENNTHCQELHFVAKCKKNTYVTTREMAKCVSQVMGKSFVPIQGSKNVLGKEYEPVILIEDTKYKCLTGVARCRKEGEELYGDNYSFLKLDSGELVMTLADGMGTGEAACAESTSVVELMESFLEAGVREQTAIRLINSIFVLQAEEQRLSTLDLVAINLYTGVCDFVKMGAATAFIKRDDGVERIESTSLPMGVFLKAEYDEVSKKLYDGDFVILLSDGILDTAPTEEKEAYYKEFIQKRRESNPNELANGILKQAIVNCGGEVVDDMTVLVTGVWMKE